MPLTVPPCDGRRYEQLLDEALARIPVHNPEWTNFNRSDPGVTLLELFAFLPRACSTAPNLIPDRNRSAFLSLLGVPLLPAEPARGLVAFDNERGPLATVTLPPDVEVRAGEVPFRTETGLDVLPVRPASTPSARRTLTPDLEEIYRQLYASFLGEDASTPPAADLQLYETRAARRPRPRRGRPGRRHRRTRRCGSPCSPREGEDLAGDAGRRSRGAVLHLGRRARGRPTRGARCRRRAGAAERAGATWSSLLPDVPVGGLPPDAAAAGGAATATCRARRWVAVNPLLRARRRPARRCPPAAELRTWEELEPLEAGVGDFPPALERPGTDGPAS